MNRAENPTYRIPTMTPQRIQAAKYIIIVVCLTLGALVGGMIGMWVR